MADSYLPGYCEKIIAHGEAGGSIESFAGVARVCRKTLYLWREKYPDFDEAAAISKSLALLWWENRLKHVSLTGEGNAPTTIFGVKNRSEGVWRDVTQTELSGPDGGPIKGIAIRFVDPD